MPDLRRRRPMPPPRRSRAARGGVFGWLTRLLWPRRPAATILFDLITSRNALTRAWKRTRRNGGGPGGDGVTIAAYAIDARRNLEALRCRLIEGHYRPGPLRRADISKRGGGTRTLAIPGVADRIVQAATAATLDPLLDAHMAGTSFAYRSGRSVRQAVRRVRRDRDAGFCWVVDGDIHHFFDSVPHARLVALLRERITDARVIALIELWLRGFGPRRRGLAQGSPLSPLLANLYLDPIDKRIEAPDARLVRYADDFLILCPSHAAAERALRRMGVLLRDHGLRLHPSKTIVTSFAAGFDFLGYRFHGRRLGRITGARRLTDLGRRS